MEDLIKKFLVYLDKDKKLSDNTLQSYKRDIDLYCRYLANTNTNILTVDANIINGYLEHLKLIGKKTTTISRYLASIRAFHHYINKIGLTSTNPTDTVDKPTIEKTAPKILSIKQVEHLLNQPNGKDLKSIRDKAMLELLYATGIRVTELMSLNVENVDLNTGFIKCISERRERNIPLGNLSIKALRNYIYEARPHLMKNDSNNSLFVNTNGERMTRQGFWKIIKYYKDLANIEENITPHTLRHSFAVHLIENGAELKNVQKMMGHADIASTQVYLQLDGIKDAYNKTHPRA